MYVEIPLDKPRRLRFTINAMRDLERQFGGTSLSKLFDADTAGIDRVVHLIWIGLKHGGDRKITVDQVGDLLQEYFLDAGKPLVAAMDYVTKALQQGGFLSPDEDLTQSDKEGAPQSMPGQVNPTK